MRVSIVTISFNQAEFLERAIRSVIEQDYPDVEYIVVDPGSTDGSREIIEKYRSRISKVILEPDTGPANGLNKGFAAATGEIFGYINADDAFLPKASVIADPTIGAFGFLTQRLRLATTFALAFLGFFDFLGFFAHTAFAAGVTERYGAETQVSAFDGVTTQVTEMDALVAYLQILGRLTGAAYENTAAPEQKPEG